MLPEGIDGVVHDVKVLLRESYALAREDVRYVAPRLFSALYDTLMFIRKDLVCEKDCPELEIWLSDREESHRDCIL